MTQVIRRRDPVAVIADNHTRIRRIEATPAQGGSGGGDCPDCVLDPYTINPNDIFVPPEYRECVNAIGGCVEFDGIDVPPNTNQPLTAVLPAGFCSAGCLDPSLGIQARIATNLGFNIASLSVFIGQCPAVSSQFIGASWGIAENPATADTGWFDVPLSGTCPGEPNCGCAAICIGAFASQHSNFSSNGVGPGTFCFRWVALGEDGEFRGALDDLPQGEAFGDTLHFNSETHDWVIGPRSVPSRAISAFMGGR